MLTIEQPIIKSFSTLIRFLHLSLQILASHLILSLGNSRCSTTISSVSMPIAIIIFIVNFVGILFIKFTKKYSVKLFYGVATVNLGLSGVLMVVGLLGIGQANSCANNRVLHRFVGFQALIAIVLGVMTILAPYDFSIRYTNAPSNLTWVFMFFSFSWPNFYNKFYTFVGVLNLLITIAVLSVHVVFLMSNFNDKIKRPIFLVWMGSLLALAVAEGVVLIAYVTGNNGDSAIQAVAVKLAQVFIFVNLIDVAFWIFGMVGLKIKSEGDLHDVALGICQRDERVY